MRRLLKFAAIAALLSTTGCLERIDTGNAGIQKSFSGEVSQKTLPQGMYTSVFTTIYEVSGKEDTIAFNDLHPKSKDNLTMEDLDVDITIQVNLNHAALIYSRFSNDLHWNKDIGAYTVGNNYVARKARAIIYQVVALHDAQTMHQIRNTLEEEITKDLQKELDVDMGKDWIMVRNVNIRNLITDKNVEQSIREIAAANFKTQQKIAEQNAARQEAIRLEIEKTGVAKAEAARMQIDAEAKARANKTIADSLTPVVLEALRIEMMREFAGKGNSTVLLPQGQPITPMINTGK